MVKHMARSSSSSKPDSLEMRLEAITAELYKLAPKTQHKLAEEFMRHMLSPVAVEDLAQGSPEDWAGAALSLLDFARERQAGQSKIRAFNPTMIKNGWQARHTVLELVNQDRPFLVDSVTAALNQLGFTVRLVLHPVLRMKRDDKGKLLSLQSEGGQAESLIQIAFDECRDDAQLQQIETALKAVLADVIAATDDWLDMRTQVQEAITQIQQLPANAASAEECTEVQEFLRWLEADHFTFLGYRDYTRTGSDHELRLSITPNKGLGILRRDATLVFEGLRDLAAQPPELRKFMTAPRLVAIIKTHRLSTVHRAVPLDAIMIKRFNSKGQVVGERLFVGLFTSMAYGRNAHEVPLLRAKLARVMARSGLDPKGHDGKALAHILATYPRDELYQIGENELTVITAGILQLQERQRVALFIRRDPFQRFVTCLVYCPRDRYNTELRQKFQSILEAGLSGRTTHFNVRIDDNAFARCFLVLRTEPGSSHKTDLAELEQQLVDAARSWGDKLRRALIQRMGDTQGKARAAQWGQAFPMAYREQTVADTALADIDLAEWVLRHERLSVNLQQQGRELSLKLYHPQAPITLARVMPLLENMGLAVFSENGPFEITPKAGHKIWLHDFRATPQNNLEIHLPSVKLLFEDALIKAWSGELENDGFNRLVLLAGLSWREVLLLRAHAKYLRQTGLSFSLEIIAQTLAQHAPLAKLLVQLFHAKFDPSLPRAKATAQASALEAQILDALEAISNIDEDRILRRLLNLQQATLRTNYYQVDADKRPKTYVSFKFDAARITDLPLPRPQFEVYVYSARMEAVHLRGGKVARGGIRWSDRLEDFRTEILGLMKAQMVKNSIIVPVGAKGGFIVKQPAENRQAEAIECYKFLVRGLLDITDNIKQDKIVPPPLVVRHDDDDPYLVVAADKGTAKFSDIANALSREYGFWLDDAFASGGSAGYDHKHMGITAKGAWEAVKRHFRERGKDCQQQSFSCIGVGDMAGDVFGNGLLQSPHTQLVAAFNHSHIFLDPNPDAKKSYQERLRLFQGVLGWGDYNSKALGKGGGVFLRSAKSITVSADAVKRFKLPQATLSPSELVRALLQAEVELLYFGGIGTFIKAADEAHSDVGDKANDALRIDAEEAGAAIIAEGANLGLTQRARIAFARKGGRLNTDAIDNSGGVDTSDHEVNIKILLQNVMAAGALSLKQRDTLLAKMTDEVASLVLRDNYLQTQTLSLAERRAAELLPQHRALLDLLSREANLNRKVEYLPQDAQLKERARNGEGLSRPELAVLLAYVKIWLKQQMLQSELLQHNLLQQDLLAYFPKPLQRSYASFIETHKLRREILATSIANEVINRLGLHTVPQLAQKHGVSVTAVMTAYVLVRELFELPSLFNAIEAQDGQMPTTRQYALLQFVTQQAKQAMSWMLLRGPRPLDIDKALKRFRPALQSVGNFKGELPPELTDAPMTLANKLAILPHLVPVLDLADLAERVHAPHNALAHIYQTLDEHLSLSALRVAIKDYAPSSQIEREALVVLRDEAFAAHRKLTEKLSQKLDQKLAQKLDQKLGQKSGKDKPASALNNFLATDDGVKRYQQLWQSYKATPDLASFTLLVQALRELTDD